MNSLDDVGDQMREDHDSSNRSQAQRYQADQQAFQDGLEAISKQSAESSRIYSPTPSVNSGSNILFGQGALNPWALNTQAGAKNAVEERSSTSSSSTSAYESVSADEPQNPTEPTDGKLSGNSQKTDPFYKTNDGMNRIRRSNGQLSTSAFSLPSRRSASAAHLLNYSLPFQSTNTIKKSSSSWRIVKSDNSH